MQDSPSSKSASATLDSATQALIARDSTFGLAINTSSELSSPGLSPASSSKAQASEAHTNTQTDEEEEEAKPPDLAKVMAEILDFPEDLEGPNNPALLVLVEPASFGSNEQLQGMVAASSRLFRPAGK